MDSPKANADREHNAPLLESERHGEDIQLSRLDGSFDLDDEPEISYETKDVVKIKRGTRSYLAIALALALTVMGLTINTEATAYYEDVLGWKKPFMSMYITHSALGLPWFCHLIYSRWQRRNIPYKAWVREYNDRLRESVTSIDAYESARSYLVFKRKGQTGGPLDYLASAMLLVTVVLTASGCSWFLSLVLTTPADLTAIYNCSTFFAAVFSVPILKERLGWISILAVALSIGGTFIIAYGDSTSEHDENEIGTSRLLGNMVACVGAVAFGLYEVLFKKFACSSRVVDPAASLPLTFAASALTGIFTFATVWILIFILHLTGVEPIVMPGWTVIGWIVIAALTGSSTSPLFLPCPLRKHHR